MTDAHVSAAFGATAKAIREDLHRFIVDKIKSTVELDADHSASSPFSSTFTIKLVVHLESSGDIAVIGPQLKQALSLPGFFEFSHAAV
jgi:methoxymalonate biosynthesis acyl carrier protein